MEVLNELRHIGERGHSKHVLVAVPRYVVVLYRVLTPTINKWCSTNKTAKNGKYFFLDLSFQILNTQNTDVNTLLLFSIIFYRLSAVHCYSLALPMSENQLENLAEFRYEFLSEISTNFVKILVSVCKG